MRHLLAVDLDAPVLVVVSTIFGVRAQASSSGHALGVDAVLENTLVQDHGTHCRALTREGNELGLGMRMNYAVALYRDPSATLDDLREAVTTLENTERIARRVFGGAHPMTRGIEENLQVVRAALRARETPPPAGGA